MTAPVGADQLDGVTDVYESYTAALEARNADRTRETIDALGEAATALNGSRQYWREIRDAVAAGFAPQDGS